MKAIKTLNKQILVYVMVITVVTVLAFPYYWLFNTSLQVTFGIDVYPPKFIPPSAGFANYLNVFKTTAVSIWLLNSLKVSGMATILSVSLGILGAYSLSRFRFRPKIFLMFFILFSQMILPMAVIIPIYIFFKQTHLLGKHLGLVILYSAYITPVATFFLKGYFDSIPFDLEEAGLIDGCSRLQSAVHILLPLARPGIIGTFSLLFVICWREYLFAVTLISEESKWTMPVGVASFIGVHGVSWADIMTVAVLATIPVFALFLILQKYLIQGLSAGGLKG